MGAWPARFQAKLLHWRLSWPRRTGRHVIWLCEVIYCFACLHISPACHRCRWGIWLCSHVMQVSPKTNVSHETWKAIHNAHCKGMMSLCLRGARNCHLQVSLVVRIVGITFIDQQVATLSESANILIDFQKHSCNGRVHVNRFGISCPSLPLRSYQKQRQGCRQHSTSRMVICELLQTVI